MCMCGVVWRGRGIIHFQHYMCGSIKKSTFYRLRRDTFLVTINILLVCSCQVPPLYTTINWIFWFPNCWSGQAARPEQIPIPQYALKAILLPFTTCQVKTFFRGSGVQSNLLLSAQIMSAVMALTTGCPTIEFSLCFACFLSFQSSYRRSFYHFTTAQET